MSNVFWKTTLVIGISIAVSSGATNDLKIEPGPQSVLIFENVASTKTSAFVVRIARYRPDVVFEWENVNDQGTVHLFRDAVSHGEGFTLSSLFEVGVNSESPDVMTLWLSAEVHRQLIDQGAVKLKRNRLTLKLQKTGLGEFGLKHNGRQIEIPVLFAKDERDNLWTISADPENPLLVAYESKYFKQNLKSIATGSKPSLRWIKKLPPIQ